MALESICVRDAANETISLTWLVCWCGTTFIYQIVVFTHSFSRKISDLISFEIWLEIFGIWGKWEFEIWLIDYTTFLERCEIWAWDLLATWRRYRAAFLLLVFLKIKFQLISLDYNLKTLAFSALTPLVGCQEGHPARKNLTDEVLVWLSAGAKCKY